MEFTTLKPEHLLQWTQFCGHVFERESEYFMRHFQNDPDRDIKGIFVAYDNDRIASTLRVFTRHMQINGETVKVGGIGEVSTHKDYRKRGLSSALLKMAIEYMKDHDMPLSFLHTGINSHYEKKGWNTINTFHKVYSIRRCELPEGFTVRRVDDISSLEMSNIKRLFSHHAPSLCPVYIRSDEYYDTWVKGELENLYFLEKDNYVVSYADFRKIPPLGILAKEYIGGEYIDLMRPFFYQVAMQEKWPRLFGVSAPFAVDEKHKKLPENGLMFRINSPFTINGKTIIKKEDFLPFVQNFPVHHIDGY